MNCPRCGSKDVEDTPRPEVKAKVAECNACGYEWTLTYDPWPKAES